MSAIAIGLASAAGTLAQAYSEKRQGDYNASVYNAQANSYKDASFRKRLETAINVDTQREQNRRDVARAIASSVELGMSNSDTTTNAIGQYASDLEKSANAINYQGLSQAESMSNMASSYQTMARYEKRKGKNAWNQGLLKAPLSYFSGYIGSGIDNGQEVGNIAKTLGGLNDIWDYTQNPNQQSLSNITKKYKNWSFGG